MPVSSRGHGALDPPNRYARRGEGLLHRVLVQPGALAVGDDHDLVRLELPQRVAHVLGRIGALARSVDLDGRLALERFRRALGGLARLRARVVLVAREPGERRDLVAGETTRTSAPGIWSRSRSRSRGESGGSVATTRIRSLAMRAFYPAYSSSNFNAAELMQ